MIRLTYTYASEDPTGIAAELVSLVLIILSFAVITYVASRRRGIRTFQFEMFLFTIVLVAAEVPRTLYSLGVIDIDALSTVGLAIHSVSMVILGAFVAFRIRGFFSAGRALAKDFPGLVRAAVSDAVSASVGFPTMKALDFYVNGDQAVSDPRAYETSLGKFFGSGSTIMLDKIVQGVCDASKIERKPGFDLQKAIEEGRQKYLATGSPVS